MVLVRLLAPESQPINCLGLEARKQEGPFFTQVTIEFLPARFKRHYIFICGWHNSNMERPFIMNNCTGLRNTKGLGSKNLAQIIQCLLTQQQSCRILRYCIPRNLGPSDLRNSVQGWAKEMELSCEKVSARLQPATAGHARLVLSKTVPFFCTTLYSAGRPVIR